MKIVVAGGRDEADFLIGLLLMGKHKIIAINGDMGYCEHLAASYDAASVIYGDPCKEYVMDEAGVNYQLNTSTEDDVFIRAFAPSKAEGVDSIIVGALVNDERVAFETSTLVTADTSDMATLYQALNAINADATFVRFVLNTNDGSIIARMELPVLGDEDFGYVVERYMLAVAVAVDDSYNALAALA